MLFFCIIVFFRCASHLIDSHATSLLNVTLLAVCTAATKWQRPTSDIRTIATRGGPPPEGFQQVGAKAVESMGQQNMEGDN
eukprot:s46_g57.t1